MKKVTKKVTKKATVTTAKKTTTVAAKVTLTFKQAEMIQKALGAKSYKFLDSKIIGAKVNGTTNA